MSGSTWGFFCFAPLLCAPRFSRDQWVLRKAAASHCEERNSLVVARGVLLLSVSICQSAAELSLALERSLRKLGLVRVWEIILGLYNLIWPQEVKSLAALSCVAGLLLHSNGFDSEASLRSPLLAPASHSVS